MPSLSITRLRRKQSVRVTFKLNHATIDLLSAMACQLGIKQKTLFDQLIDHHHVSPLSPTTEQDDQPELPRRQKTFVLSQETVETLNLLAEKYQTPRNILVEMAIRRLLPILALEQERHEKRKILLGEITQEMERTGRLLEQAVEVLGPEDPICTEVREANQGWLKAYGKVMAIIERGKDMEKL